MPVFCGEHFCRLAFFRNGKDCLLESQGFIFMNYVKICTLQSKKARKHGAPEPDGSLKVVARKKIIHYRQLYIDRPDPIAFI